jgi:initiation factor 1A
MVLNKTGGNKTKKQKRNFGKYDAVDKIEPDQMFAQITKNYGGSFSVLCSDGITRLGKLSGYMKKGPRLSEGSFVVISLRDFEAEHKNCDIIAYGDPPNDIINVFKTNDPNKNKRADVEFVDSDNEFTEFEESSRTIINSDQQIQNLNLTNSDKKINDDDIWADI